MNRVLEHFEKDPGSYWAKYSAATALGYAFRVRRESLLSFLGHGGGRVLDVGCGPGVITREILDRGWHYQGIDLSPQMIRVAEQKFGNRPGANFAVGQVERLNFPDNYFDVVIAMGLVEYLDDEARALTEIRRVLKPSGRLIISIPNWWSPARMWDRWLLTPIAKTVRWLTGGGPSSKLNHREYKIKEYQKLLAEHGFQTIRWQSYNYRMLPRPFDFWWPNLAIRTADWCKRVLSKLWWLGTSINVEAIKRQIKPAQG